MSFKISAKEAQDYGYVVGLQDENVQSRLEIDEFVLDRDVLNLFLIALINLQQKDYRDPWSWFQISGIHGRPFSPWDEEKSKPSSTQNRTNEQAGYCSHSSVTFPTWHRPYVAMMEQAVYVEMVKAAEEYSDEQWRQSYLEACSRFRFPYWDPCILRKVIYESSDDPMTIEDGFGVPLIVSSQKVWLRWPHNPDTLTEEDNPLYQYKFPEIDRSSEEDIQYWRSFWGNRPRNVLFDDSDLRGTSHTVRAPDNDGKTQDTAINSHISRNINGYIGGSLYKVLALQQSWNNFSNDLHDSKTAQSLEGWHDNMHNILGQGTLSGGSGNMAWPQYAAFDPIFWLHHCNIDRLTALWQAKKGPNNWWNEHVAIESTWTVPKGSVQRPTDPLHPFRSSKKNPSNEVFWSSDDTKDWTKLGYNYLGKYIAQGSSGKKEIVPFPISLNQTNSTELTAFFSQFYSWADIATPDYPDILKEFYPIDISSIEALTAKEGHEPKRPPIFKSHPSGAPRERPPPLQVQINYSHIPSRLRQGGKLRQWDIHILAEKFKFGGSYQVFVFLGPFNADEPDSWPSEKSLVGIDGIFSNDPSGGGCTNCEQQAEAKIMVEDVMPLTQHLLRWIASGERCPPGDSEAICCEGLEYEQVSRFLRKNLHWRVADMNLNRIENVGDCVKVNAADRFVYLPEYHRDEVRFSEKTEYAGLEASHARGERYQRGDNSHAEYGERKEERSENYRAANGGEAQESENKESRFCGGCCIVL